MKALEARNLTFQYRGRLSPVLDNISFDLEAGKIVLVTGPSGCGKSTLGYCISGVIPRLIKGHLQGTVVRQGRVGIVFEDPDTQILFPTVEDELAFGPENLCLPRDEIEKRINSTLEVLGLTGLRKHNPSRLSGGQKQLVVLGGVLTMEPDIMVLDETLSQLDAAAQESVKRVFEAFKQQGKTIIMIEHDRSHLNIADEIWYLENGKMSQFPAQKGER